MSQTAEQFERRYAERSGLSIEGLRSLGYVVRPCACEQEGCAGWKAVRLPKVYIRRSLRERAIAFLAALEERIARRSNDGML